MQKYTRSLIPMHGSCMGSVVRGVNCRQRKPEGLFERPSEKDGVQKGREGCGLNVRAHLGSDPQLEVPRLSDEVKRGSHLSSNSSSPKATKNHIYRSSYPPHGCIAQL